MYYYRSAEQDETISQQPAVSQFLEIVLELAAFQSEGGRLQRRGGIQSRKDHSVNDFPEEGAPMSLY